MWKDVRPATTWRFLCRAPGSHIHIARTPISIACYLTIPPQGRFEGIKLVYVGDGNNMVNSWMRLATVFPYELVVCCPEGYGPDPATLKYCQEAGLSKISVSHDPMEAVKVS